MRNLPQFVVTLLASCVAAAAAAQTPSPDLRWGPDLRPEPGPVSLSDRWCES